MSLKLGKKPFVPDERDITFQAIADEAGITIPTAPPRFGHGLDFSDWLMLGNGPDNSVEPGFRGAGCCVLSDAGHQTMLTNKLGGHPITITGKEVIQAYSDITGYVIGDDTTDNGTWIRDALQWRRNVGIADVTGKRHKIGAYVSISAKNWEELMSATWVFTSISIGFAVPDTIWDQFDNHEPWDVVDPNAPIIGGHDVPIMGRSSIGVGGCISWARRVGMTRAFYETYNDETWAIVFPEELKNGKTEHGYDLTGLNNLLKAFH